MNHVTVSAKARATDIALQTMCIWRFQGGGVSFLKEKHAAEKSIGEVCFAVLTIAYAGRCWHLGAFASEVDQGSSRDRGRPGGAACASEPSQLSRGEWSHAGTGASSHMPPRRGAPSAKPRRIGEAVRRSSREEYESLYGGCAVIRPHLVSP